jgi:hypothetical protein
MWRGERQMKTDGKMDFRTKQETITVFCIFSSKSFTKFTFLLVHVCECIEQGALILKRKSNFTKEYNNFRIQ